MSFWEDLQAWAQAQYDALVLANLKRKRKWTAEEINQLLRDRIVKRLKAKQGKAMPAEFLRNGGRSGPRTPALSGVFSGLFYTSNPITPVVDGAYSRIDPHNWDAKTYGPWQTSEQMATLFHYGTADSFYYKKAGMYTGLMREVVQLLIGVDAEFTDGKAGHIPYEFRWANCHGIFRNRKTGAWWVIWIDSTAGISAWPLTYVKILTDLDRIAGNTTAPGVPASVPIYPRGSVAGFREIMSLGDLEEAYTDGAPFYPEHGWAFSYDGSEAQAITITYANEWKVANRWKLSFTADNNGDPVSATLELQEQKCLFGAEESAPKYPQAAQGSLISYDIYYPVTNPQPFANDAPVDVFYRRGSMSVPIIVRYGSYGDQAYTETDEITWPPDGPSPLCGATAIPGDVSISGDYVAEVEKLTETTKVHYTIEGVDTPIAPEQNYIHEIPQPYTLTWTQDGDWNVINLSGGGSSILSEHWQGELDRNHYDTEAKFQYEAFFKPFYDREVICLYEKKRATYATGPSDTVVTGGSTGELYSASGNAYSKFSQCGGLAYYKVPSPICSTNYAVTDMGTVLYTGVGSAASELEAPIITTDVDDTKCEGGLDARSIQYLAWCVPTSPETYTGPGCTTINAVDGETEEIYARQTVWMYDPRAVAWTKSWEVNEYDSLDPYTTYIDNPNLGAQLFSTYFDVFSGQGFSFARMNYGNTADLYYRGTLSASYNMDFGAPGIGTGWFGIP